MSKIYENIAVELDGADAAATELLKEYERSLHSKTVTAKAKKLTHDVCAQLRCALDRTAFRYWNLKIAPSLSEDDRKEAKSRVYFPAGASQASLDSTLGNWRWKSVKGNHQALYDFFLSQQPFSSDRNKWLTALFDLSVQGKHIDLVPQKRFENRRIHVEAASGGGSVNWDPSAVRFGGPPGSVRIMGAPIDPTTQRIMPTPGITEWIETWVGFEIVGYGVNAAGFCKEACRETRRIIQEMTDKFGLS